MLRSAKGKVKPSAPENTGHIPNEIKNHGSDSKVRIIPDENKTHSKGEESRCKLVPGKGSSKDDLYD